MALSTLSSVPHHLERLDQRGQLDDRRPPPAGIAAAMSRHPAGGHGVRPASPPSATGRVASFPDLVDLLTGAWRVGDPDGFAAAMTGAALIGGHAVLDLADCTSQENIGGCAPDPWSIRAWAALRAVLGGLAERRTLDVACVSAEHAGQRIAESRAHAPAGRAEVECLVLAHLVEPLNRGRRRPGDRPLDHSWMLLVVGDGSGGVASVTRAVLACPGRPRCCRGPAPWARPALIGLRDRLLVAPGAPPLPPPDEAGAGVVVPFLRR